VRVLRRPGRRLHLDEEIALVLVRQERGWQMDEQPSHRRDHHGVDREPAPEAPDNVPHSADVLVAAAVEAGD